MTDGTAVIVGASVGGVRTAQALRSVNYRGRIVLVSAETVLPYDKPPLSKGLLAGTTTSDDIALLSHAEAGELGIELRLGWRAKHLRVADCVVESDTGRRLTYQHLVVATGARARPAPWGHLKGVHVVRTLDDSLRLREDLRRGGRLVVIGGGFIGAEIAATARSLGLEVTLVDRNPVPMQRVLGDQIGERFAHLHERNGVRIAFGVEVTRVTGQRGRLCVFLDDGEILHADSIVVGIGAIPNDGWLACSGLTIDNGVVCDQYSRAVGTTNVFAVGDVARWQNPRHDRLTRAEHWTNANDQASVVAHNISNPHDLRHYAPVEFVWSDQYDWKIRVAGTTSAAHVEVIDNSSCGAFAALYRAEIDRLTGIVVVNWPRALIVGRKALADATPYLHVKEALARLCHPDRRSSGVQP